MSDLWAVVAAALGAGGVGVVLVTRFFDCRDAAEAQRAWIVAAEEESLLDLEAEVRSAMDRRGVLTEAWMEREDLGRVRRLAAPLDDAELGTASTLEDFHDRVVQLLREHRERHGLA